MTADDRREPRAPTNEEMFHLALRVAVLGVLAEDAKSAYLLARNVAQPRFALARKLGQPQQAVVLPGGVEAGKLALKQGATTIDVDEEKLLGVVASATPSDTEHCATDAARDDPRTIRLLVEHCPDLVELRLKPGALADDRAVGVLSEHAPDLVGRRIAPKVRAGLQEYLEAHEGCVPDPATGEPVQVATVAHHDPTGDFSWTGKTKYLGRVRQALEAGRLVVTAAGDVAETIPGETGPAAVGSAEGGEAA